MQVAEQTKELKYKLKGIENILLVEVLIRSLKGNQNNPLLPPPIKSNQRNLFQSAASYSKALSANLGVVTNITNKRMDTLSVIIELLNEISPNADYVIQNLVEFLRVLITCSKGSKIDGEKYEALLSFFITEVQNEYDGKETNIIYSKENNTLEQRKKEKIYGT